MTTKRKLRVVANAPVRKAVAGVDTYHDDKESAIEAVCAACYDCGFATEPTDLIGDDGYTTWRLFHDPNGRGVINECEPLDNCIAIAWYTMPSGRIELTVYVSI